MTKYRETTNNIENDFFISLSWVSYLFLGGLLGDAFLHLIPHAMMASGGEGHGHSHSHGHSHGGDEAEEGHVHDLRYYPLTHFSFSLFFGSSVKAGFFWTFREKLKAQKTQAEKNSNKFFRKTQYFAN